MKKRIFEHTIEIPDWSRGLELINEGKSYEDSFWRKLEFPKIFYDLNQDTKQFASETVYNFDNKLISLSQEDSHMIQNLLKKDLHRRKYGVHLKNGDDIVWIAPDYYFFLQWFQQKDLEKDANGEKLGGIRLIQNEILQLWEYVKWDSNIAGLIVPKIKKCGITYLFAAAFLNEGLLNKDWDIMMMSKDFDTCKNSLFTFIKFAYNELPWALKAKNVKNENQSLLAFGAPKNNPANENYSNTKFVATKTKTAAFDGPVPKRCWWDEFPKTWEASKISVKDTFDKSIEAIKVNQEIRGKLLMTSYMPERADAGFLDARSICEKSLLKTIKPGNLRTESGMIICPIYAYQSNQECFDKYGRCNEIEARKIVEKEYSAKQTASDKQTFKRQYPLTWEDMFDNTGRGATFDNVRLSMQQKKLRELDQQGNILYKEGNLYWENSMYEEYKRPIGKFSKVYFKELTLEEKEKGVVGSIKIFHDLSEMRGGENFLNPIINNNLILDGLYYPPPKGLFVSTIDPVDKKNASDVQDGSLNASYGGFIYDQNIDSIVGKQITDEPIYEYNFRHENPDRIFEDMVKIIFYWGAYCLIEANRDWLSAELKEHGLSKFLLLRQKDGSITPYDENQNYKGGNKPIHSDSNMIRVYIRAIERYIAEPKKDMVNNIERIKSVDLIEQLINFDPLNTRRFDLAVSFGYWRVAIENHSIWLTYKSGPTSILSDAEIEARKKVLKSILG